MWQRLSSSNRPLDKVTKAMLKVEILAPASAILMKHIEDDCCDEEFLKMYFGNKKKSGAGVNVTVEITGRGQALVTIKDLSGECEEFNLGECIQYCLIKSLSYYAHTLHELLIPIYIYPIVIFAYVPYLVYLQFSMVCCPTTTPKSWGRTYQ